MSEIRQIQVDGVNYDLVITEDEVAATRAEQAAAQAATSASQAAANSAQASEYSITAGEYAQDAEDAADRAEAIVGGQFVSYGQSQGLTEAEKTTARTNIGVTKHTNPNLLDNWYFVGDGTPKTFPINQRGKNYYAVNDYTIDRWKSVNLWGNSCTVKVATQPGGLVLAGDINTDNPNTYVQFQQIVENPPYGKEVTLSLLVDTFGADDDGNYPQIWCGASAYKNITAVGLSSLTFTWPSDQTENYVRIVLYDGATQASSIRIQAIKLELGAVSTLEQDAAPDYGIELTRCLYSKADLADSYSNSGYGRTNPNLLDNAYFVGGGSQLGDGIFPINQRGQTSYTGGITGFDRWTVDGGDFTATLESGGVRITSTTPYAGLAQIIPAYKLQNGETYTYSIVVDGVLHTAAFVANSDGNWANIYYSDDWYVPYQFSNGKWTFKIINTLSSAGMNHLISKVKLEKGAVSTLANDPTPDFGEELRKCQRYLRYVPLIRTLISLESTYTIAIMTLEGIQMASYPTATLSQVGTVQQFSPLAWATPTGVSVIAFNHYTPTIQINLSAALDGVGKIVDTIVCLNCEL